MHHRLPAAVWNDDEDLTEVKYINLLEWIVVEVFSFDCFEVDASPLNAVWYALIALKRFFFGPSTLSTKMLVLRIQRLNGRSELFFLNI